MRGTMPLRGILAFVIVSLTATSLGATKSRGTFKNWSSHLLTEKKTRICFVHAEPAKKRGRYKKRGAVFVQISYHPSANVVGEVGFTAGYTYKKSSDAVVEIDSKKFTLFTHKDSAWASDAKSDKALVQAMKKGQRMIVRGTSVRGTKTVDTYSLIGFTRAYKAIGKACKSK